MKRMKKMLLRSESIKFEYTGTLIAHNNLRLSIFLCTNPQQSFWTESALVSETETQYNIIAEACLFFFLMPKKVGLPFPPWLHLRKLQIMAASVRT